MELTELEAARAVTQYGPQRAEQVLIVAGHPPADVALHLQSLRYDRMGALLGEGMALEQAKAQLLAEGWPDPNRETPPTSLDSLDARAQIDPLDAVRPALVRNHTPGLSADNKPVAYARSAIDVANELRQACMGWPRRLPDGSVFVDTTEGLRIYSRQTMAQLYALLQGAGVSLRLAKSVKSEEGITCKPAMEADIYEAFLVGPYAAPMHEATWPVLQHPIDPGCYYSAKASAACRRAPKLAPGEALAGLLDRLPPPTMHGLDGAILCALAATVLSSRTTEHRAAFALTSPDAQGAGKSTTIRLLAQLGTAGHGEAEITARKDEREPLATRLLTPGAELVPVIHVENPTGRLDSADWAQLMTAPRVSGRALYVGEKSRPNRHTWVMSYNGADTLAGMSADLVSRFVHVSTRKHSARYPIEEVEAYAREMAPSIRADLLEILRAPPALATVEALAGVHRSGLWVREVLAPCVEWVAARVGVEPQALAAEIVALQVTRRKGALDVAEDAALPLSALALALADRAGEPLVIAGAAMRQFADAWLNATKGEPPRARGQQHLGAVVKGWGLSSHGLLSELPLQVKVYGQNARGYLWTPHGSEGQRSYIAPGGLMDVIGCIDRVIDGERSPIVTEIGGAVPKFGTNFGTGVL